jgi:MoaA/NifB/PqqE/SkfB family radical SAM enzyme
MNQIIFAQIEPTTKCNFTCGFCCGRQMDQSDLSLQQLQQALDLFPEIQHLELQGEGEPLIHPDFFAMVELATAKQIQLSLITNGSLFTSANIQRLLNSRITSIRISVETTDPEKFKAIRGGSFPIVEQGIQRLIAARQQRGQEYPSIGLAVTVLASTLADLPNIFEWYDRLGLDGGIAIQGLNKIPQYAQYYDAAMQQEYLVREQHETEYRQHMSREIVQKIWQTKSPYTNFYDELFKPTSEDIAQGKRTACPWLESGIYIDRHSRVTPCCMVKGETWSFGTVETLDRETLLQEREQLSTQLKSGTIPIPCQGCHIAAEVVA